MSADQSVFAVLGLDPDADDAAIERAYRRLIKRHHPDRSGGDNARATEINRAYHELRAERDLRDPLDFNETDEPLRRERRVWLLLALVLTVASLFLLWRASPTHIPFGSVAMPAPTRSPAGKQGELGTMDRPLALADIDRATADAARLRQTSDEMTMANHSRACHQTLRTRPTLTLFDECAAFDDAVVTLENRDPLRDQGPFSELAVTGRIRSAAALLSDDSVAIDARLDRIRRQVDATLSGAGN